MAVIERKLLAETRIGARIFDAGGRTMVRITDDVLPPIVRLTGMLALCDLSGNLITCRGDIEMTVVEMDLIDPILDLDGQDILLRGWQGSVN